MAQEAEVEPYPEVGFLSTFSVFQPFFASSKLIAAPITPAPIIIAS